MDYPVPFLIFALSIIFDGIVSIFLKKRSQLTKYIAAGNNTLIMFASTSFIFFDISVISVLLFTVSVFRFINTTRVVSTRMNSKELELRYTRSFFWLSGFSIALVGLMYTGFTIDPQNALLISSLAGSTILFLTTAYSMIRWRNRHLESGKITTLPTVSVCIPARNETQDLPECIESILSSTYPKLEVLVLDDCSHDKTPTIIKEYAHRGVRFIKGQEPSSSWVAKNSAMNKLFEESRGEIVIFAGVDVRFKPDSVHHIIEQLEYGLLDMISVIPRRVGASEWSVFIQPLRYWWELSVPRLFGKRPPALSTLWAIKRKKLISIGGFESAKKSVRPEAHFAKRLSKSYRFVLSGNVLGITSIKGPREQFDTALRMRYPQARRRPESVLAIILIEFIVFFSPLILLVVGILNNDPLLVAASSVAIGMLVIINLYISYLTVEKTWFVGLVSLPFLILEEWYVLIRSMLAYEFGSVRWKERNICLPMLQPEKELPKL
jgi:glycosyltransferase involved in cell wall biosynthesis